MGHVVPCWARPTVPNGPQRANLPRANIGPNGCKRVVPAQPVYPPFLPRARAARAAQRPPTPTSPYLPHWPRLAGRRLHVVSLCPLFSSCAALHCRSGIMPVASPRRSPPPHRLPPSSLLPHRPLPSCHLPRPLFSPSACLALPPRQQPRPIDPPTLPPASWLSPSPALPSPQSCRAGLARCTGVRTQRRVCPAYEQRRSCRAWVGPIVS